MASNAASGSAPRFTIGELQTVFELKCRLGSGNDGVVTIRQHRKSGRLVAVKMAATEEDWLNIGNEVTFLEEAQGCHQVVNLMAVIMHDSQVIGLGMEPCIGGSAASYCDDMHDKFDHVPEQILWKLFIDVSKGLNFLHNEKEVPVIHGDISSENVLVAGYRTHKNPAVPPMPSFKIADFGRATWYYEGMDEQYSGNPLFHPPEKRLDFPADIWALGGTIQDLALDISPAVRDKDVAPESDPMDLWKPIYRPINVSLAELVANYSYEPEEEEEEEEEVDVHIYSDVLNNWYARCMVVEVSNRITAAQLITEMVPIAEAEINRLNAEIIQSGNPTGDK